MSTLSAERQQLRPLGASSDPFTGDYVRSVNSGWILLTTFFLGLLLVGLLLLEVGLIRQRGNVTAAITKSLASLCVGVLIWWAVGFPFAWGSTSTPDWFLGLSGFFLIDFDTCDSLDPACALPWTQRGQTYATWLQQLFVALVSGLW